MKNRDQSCFERLWENLKTQRLNETYFHQKKVEVEKATCKEGVDNLQHARHFVPAKQKLYSPLYFCLIMG